MGMAPDKQLPAAIPVVADTALVYAGISTAPQMIAVGILTEQDLKPESGNGFGQPAAGPPDIKVRYAAPCFLAAYSRARRSVSSISGASL